MVSTTSISTEIDLKVVTQCISLVLETLGDPENAVQHQALDAFHHGDSALIKRLALLNLDDNFVKSLGYLVSASKLTPNTDTIIAESARSAVEHVKDKALTAMNVELSSIFQKDEPDTEK